VGFEFLTSEDDDHDDLTLEEYNTLTAAQRRGELALFVIDEVEPVSAEALSAEAHEFLDEVADAAHARLKAATRRRKAARKPVAKTAAARKATARPAAAKRPATKKARAVKPAKKGTKKTVKKATAKKAATKRSARR
jgi:hypothetical protein